MHLGMVFLFFRAGSAMISLPAENTRGQEGQNKMKTIIHDLGNEYNAYLASKAERVIFADGRYAPCQGCFGCWTKAPAACVLKDALQEACRVLGTSDDLTLITANTYGGWSTPVKNLLDRSIGVSTPLSTYRGGQMHHTLRYGKKGMLRVIAYGDITADERETLILMAKRNAVNMGYTEYAVDFCETAEEAGARV